MNDILNKYPTNVKKYEIIWFLYCSLDLIKKTRVDKSITIIKHAKIVVIPVYFMVCDEGYTKLETMS